LLGARCDRGLEVERVGDVELGLDLHGPGEGDQLVVNRDMALVPRLGGEPIELLGHEPADRLRDEPLQLGGAHPVGYRSDMSIDVRRCRLGGCGVCHASIEASTTDIEMPGIPLSTRRSGIVRRS
jgi:hypothetical protein